MGLKKFLLPYNMLLIPVILSFTCWLLPDSLGFYKGYIRKEEITLEGGFLLFFWYFINYYLSKFFFKLGKRSFTPFISHVVKVTPFTNLNLYYILSLSAITGLLAFGFKSISMMGLNGVINTISSFQLHNIQEEAYKNYSSGIVSLRYLVIVTFGLAVNRIIGGKKRILDIINVITFIIFILLFGRRLAIIWGFICVLTIYIRSGKKININGKTILFIIAILSMIVYSSVFRGFGTYQARGYNSPLMATLANVIEYLSAPAQVQFGIINNIEKALMGISYFKFVDISDAFNTNSALANDMLDFGGWAIPLLILLVSFYSYLLGVIYNKYTSYLFLTYGIILYCFSEFWRLDMFIQGITLVMLSFTFGLPILVGFIKYRSYGK